VFGLDEGAFVQLDGETRFGAYLVEARVTFNADESGVEAIVGIQRALFDGGDRPVRFSSRGSAESAEEALRRALWGLPEAAARFVDVTSVLAQLHEEIAYVVNLDRDAQVDNLLPMFTGPRVEVLPLGA
jgi:hypothetical protein